jgi:hypothetical protein
MKKLAGSVIVAGLCTVGLLASVPGEPCCTVKSLDARTKMVTVVENKTGCTYQFQASSAADLAGLKVGSAITLDLKLLIDPADPVNGRTAGLAKKPAEPVGKPAEPITGRPAEPAGTPAEPTQNLPVRSGLSATASAASSTACGSNVARNAKTKTLCKRMTGPNSWEYVTCP